MFLVLFFFVHIYIYQLIVTFDNKLSVMYKNAFLLAIGKFPQNIVLTVVPAVAAFYLLSALTPSFATILAALVLLITLRFPMEFYAARTLKKLIEDNNAEAVEEKGPEN